MIFIALDYPLEPKIKVRTDYIYRSSKKKKCQNQNMQITQIIIYQNLFHLPKTPYDIKKIFLIIWIVLNVKNLLIILIIILKQQR